MKSDAAPHTVCQFLLVQRQTIDLHKLTTIRIVEGADFLYASLLVSNCPRVPQATRSQAPGDLGYGTTRSDYRWGLVEIHFGCLRCRMPCGFLVHRRKVICRFAVRNEKITLLLLLRMDLLRNHFVHQNFTPYCSWRVWHSPSRGR